MDAPSMVQRSGDQFIVRSVVSGDQLFVEKDAGDKKLRRNKELSSAVDQKSTNATDSDGDTVNELIINEDELAEQDIDEEEDDDEAVEGESQPQMQDEDWQQQLASLRWLLFNNNNSVMPNKNLLGTSSGAADELLVKDFNDSNLPQCKIKRNYSCSNCTYFTQNPRQYLMHLRDTHGEKLIIHECKHCIYASRHYQKLVRHMKMVHGLTVDQDGSHLAVRKRGGPSLQQQQQQQSQLQSQLLLSHFASAAKRAKSSSASSSMGADEINNNSMAAAPGDIGQSEEAKGGPSCSSSRSSNRNRLLTNTINPSRGEDSFAMPFLRRRRGCPTRVVGVGAEDELARAGDGQMVVEEQESVIGNVNEEEDEHDELPEGIEEEKRDDSMKNLAIINQQWDATLQRNHNDADDRNNSLINSSSLACKPIQLLICANINNPSSSSGSGSFSKSPATWPAEMRSVSLLDLLNGTTDSNNKARSCANTPEINNPVDETNEAQKPLASPSLSSPSPSPVLASGESSQFIHTAIKLEHDQPNDYEEGVDYSVKSQDVERMMMMLLHEQQQQNHATTLLQEHNILHGRGERTLANEMTTDITTTKTTNTNTTTTTITTPTTTPTDLDVLSATTKLNINATTTIINDNINNTAATATEYAVNTTSRVHKCTVCAFETQNRALMTEHEARDHIKTKFFRCTKCNYVTHIKTRFSKHVKYHSMPMIKCNLCDFRTPYKWNLDRHMKNHGGSGPFKCVACNFTADIKQSLTVHEMNHHDPPVGSAASSATAAGSFKQLQATHQQQHLNQRRRNRVGGSDLGNDLITAQQLAEDGGADFASGLSFHFLEGSSMLSDHLKSVDLMAVAANLKKSAARPIPNLIPILAPAVPSTTAAQSNTSALNLCHKSTDSRSRGQTDSNSETSTNDLNMDQDENSNPSVSSAFKKKHGSFFDKLKEKIGTNGDSSNLTCACGHVAKCLSELVIHQKSCQKFKQHQMSNKTYAPNLINKNSSRCQYCRHRCKSSADLVAHMQNCVNAQLFLSNALNVNIEQDSASEMGNSDKMDEDDGEMGGGDSHPMENRIFVWNKMPAESAGENNEGGSISGSEGNNSEMFTSTPIAIKQEKPDDMDLSLENNMHSTFRQSPSSGESKHLQHRLQSGGMMRNKSDPNSSTCLKKVFKCPHCSFWASTASRFHVHIVGHLNKKPFECSLCAYRSNWRWDITKHIRLKTIRDPGHKVAKVLMNDETGRRNYTKYNKYITLMKVTEGDGNLKLMKSGEMTPNQEASLQSPHDSGVNLGGGGSSSGGGNNSGSGLGKSSLSTMQKLLLNDSASSSLLKLSQGGFTAEDLLSSGTDISALLLASSQQAETSLTDSGADKKQTSFKCKRCTFKHPNRAVVQEHVKSHYREVGLSIGQGSKNSHNDNKIPAVEITPIYNTTNNNIVSGLSAADTNLLLANKTLSNFLASQNLLPIMQAAAGVSGGAQGTPNANGILMSSGGVAGVSTVDGNGHLVGGGGGTGGVLVSNHIQNLHLQSTAQSKTQPPALMGLNVAGGAAAPNVCIKILPKPIAALQQQQPRLMLGSGGGGGGNGNSALLATDSAGGVRRQVNNPANQTNDHGEMDEASSGGTVGHNYRSQLSYRCGHCQQVSNWKHVIQRHCRLKHGGNINIELIGKPRSAINAAKQTTDSNSNNLAAIGGAEAGGVLQPATNSNMNQAMITIPTLTNTFQTPPQLTPLLRSSLATDVVTSTPLNQSKEMLAVQQRFSTIINSITTGVTGDGQDAMASRKKQYECAHCSYVTDNKSQFSYHKSLHKPLAGEELQCNYCSYTATKRPLLTQHMRIHQSNPDDVIVVESENHSVFPKSGATTEKNGEGAAKPSENKENHVSGSKRKKSEYMCPYCPYSDSNGDLVNDHKQFHLAVSNERLKFNCEFCDFNAHSEKTMKDHRKLHFSFLEKGNAAVEFCTTYDKLKLFVAATAKSAGPSKDKKIYDEEEIEDENPWMHTTTTTTMPGSSSGTVDNGTVKVGINQGRTAKMGADSAKAPINV